MGDIVFLLIGVVILVGGVNASLRYYAGKLEFGVPWLRWLTFEEIVALGHSAFWTRIILPMFYRTSKIEIRISDKISESDWERAKKVGLLISTAEFYEYKFTERWKRGKEKPKKRLPEFQPMPV